MKTRKLNLEDFEGMEISKNQIKNIFGGRDMKPPLVGTGMIDSNGNPIPGSGTSQPGSSDGDPTGPDIPIPTAPIPTAGH